MGNIMRIAIVVVAVIFGMVLVSVVSLSTRAEMTPNERVAKAWAHVESDFGPSATAMNNH
jgi:hypothetical protein